MIEFFLTSVRLVRAMASAWKRDPEFRSLLFLVLLTLLGGAIFYSLEEGWSVVDAFYFSVTALTTVGLGDLAPKTAIGKLFTVVYIFAGIGIILGFIDTVVIDVGDARARKAARTVLGNHSEGLLASQLVAIRDKHYNDTSATTSAPPASASGP